MSKPDGAIWDRTPAPVRRSLIWSSWFVTWLLLVAGLFDRHYFEYVVVFSALHAVLFFVLIGSTPKSTYYVRFLTR